VIRTPVQAPNANAHAERWVRTVRSDCLDRILILGRRHLVHVLRVFHHQYNKHSHTARYASSHRTVASPRRRTGQLCRRELLGGLIHEYEAA
jgi:putative transposase